MQAHNCHPTVTCWISNLSKITAHKWQGSFSNPDPWAPVPGVFTSSYYSETRAILHSFQYRKHQSSNFLTFIFLISIFQIIFCLWKQNNTKQPLIFPSLSFLVFSFLPTMYFLLSNFIWKNLPDCGLLLPTTCFITAFSTNSNYGNNQAGLSCTVGNYKH